MSVPNLRQVSQLSEDAAGSVWALARNGIVRFEKGDTGRALWAVHDELPIWKTLAAQEADGWQPFGLGQLAVGPDGDLWVASTRGEVFHRRGTSWRTVSVYEDPWESANKMVVYRGQLHLAADSGLWKWQEGWRRPDDAFFGQSLSGIHLARSGQLYVGGQQAVWRHGDAGWHKLWQGKPAKQDRVNEIFEDMEGRVLVGTPDGFVILSPGGDELGRELRGLGVNAFATRTPGRLWVGTTAAGLRYREGTLWYSYRYAEGLPSDAVTSLLVDRRGRLWCAAGALLVADAAAAERRIKTLPHTGTLSATVFDNAGWAVEKLLADSRVSGDVAWRRTAEETLVFFNGRLVHPGSLAYDRRLRGFRRTDGAFVLMRRDWTGTLSKGDEVTDIPPPEPKPTWDYPENLLLDSRGNVWVSFGRKQGSRLLRFQRGEWQLQDQLSGLGVMSIVEGASGNIWVGSDSGHEGTLHRWDGGSWSHLKCQRREYGQGSLAIWGVHPLADGRIVLKRYATGDAVTYDPSAGELDCSRSYRFGSWDWLSQDATGRFWLSTRQAESGIAWRDGDATGRYGSRDGLFSDRVVAHAHDQAGRVWVMADDGRVGVYDLKTLVATTSASE